MRNIVERMKYLSFRNKLLISYVILIFTPISIFGYYSYNNIVQSVSANSLQTIEQRLEKENDVISGKIAQFETTGDRISTNETMRKFFSNNYYSDADMIQAINNNVYPLISWFDATYGEAGNIRFLTNNESIPESQFINWESRFIGSEWLPKVKEELEHNNYYWDGLHFHRDYFWEYNDAIQKEVISLFQKLSKSDFYTTYVEIEINPRFLFAVINDLPICQTGYIIAINSSYSTLYGNETEVYKALLDSGKIDDIDLLYNKNFPFTHDNTEYLISIEKIEAIDSFMVGIVPMKEITEPVTKYRNSFFIIFLSGLILIGVISYLTAGFLIKRIKTIVEAVRKIQNEDFNINIPIKGNDELEELAQDVNIMSGKINELINKVYKAKILQEETALNALQAQINPHFIFNTLETIRMMAELKNEDEISDVLAALGSIIRHNTNIERNFLTVDEEIDNLNNYIRIQNLMHNNRLFIQYKIDLGLNKYRLPGFIVQPIVENSILHGFQNKEDALHITIYLKKLFGSVFLIVSDNGDGIPKEKIRAIKKILSHKDKSTEEKSPYNSIGLKNISERIKLYFGDDYKIKIYNSSDRGVIIVVKFPLVNDYENRHL